MDRNGTVETGVVTGQGAEPGPLTCNCWVPWLSPGSGTSCFSEEGGTIPCSLLMLPQIKIHPKPYSGFSLKRKGRGSVKPPG